MLCKKFTSTSEKQKHWKNFDWISPALPPLHESGGSYHSRIFISMDEDHFAAGIPEIIQAMMMIGIFEILMKTTPVIEIQNKYTQNFYGIKS